MKFKFPNLRLSFERFRYIQPIKARISTDRTVYWTTTGARKTVYSLYAQFPRTDYVLSLTVTR